LHDTSNFIYTTELSNECNNIINCEIEIPFKPKVSNINSTLFVQFSVNNNYLSLLYNNHTINMLYIEYCPIGYGLLYDTCIEC